MTKKKRSFFDDFFLGGFPDFKEIDEMFEDMMKDSRKMNVEPGKPLVYGFSMHVGPDGKPTFQQFGNVEVPKGKVRNEREPLVEVQDHEREVTVIAELPGVNKDDLKLKLVNGTLVLDVQDPERKYYKEVRLPTEVDESTIKANLKNGILEIRIAKRKAAKTDGKLIKVDG